MKNAYIRFLNVIDALDRMNPGRSLDQTELALLEQVLRSSCDQRPLLVGDLLKLDQLGSQATLHSRVKNLSALGYVKLVTDKQDGRKKFVVPTKLGQKYIQFMSECLENAMKV